MNTDLVNFLRQLLFWLNVNFPQWTELWMYILNYLANFG